MSSETFKKIVLVLSCLYLGVFLVWVFPKFKPAPIVASPAPVAPVVAEKKQEVPPAPAFKVSSWSYFIKAVNMSTANQAKTDLLIIDTYAGSNKLSKENIEALKKSRKVFAYAVLGQAEDYRPYWNKNWVTNRPKWLGEVDETWKGNYIVKDVSDPQWTAITREIIEDAVKTGYDGMLIDGIQSYKDANTEQSRKQMIDFVKSMIAYAKSLNPKFVVLVQDNEELLEDDSYLKAIDGIVKQDLVFSWKSDGLKGPKNPVTEFNRSMKYLQKASKQNKAVLVVEYVSGDLWSEAKKILEQNNFVGYSAPRLLNTIRQN